ncbi:hypothetical protein [Nocardia otitidiscaviarum]|uniref:hypothetical protein n=1 Tax=Nocardia otitidiscaviarum TaxID=1823 RepID=UPI002454AE3B|nr:hypothetical protein [Nocardia otitidiscaviarum]
MIGFLDEAAGEEIHLRHPYRGIAQLRQRATQFDALVLESAPQLPGRIEAAEAGEAVRARRPGPLRFHRRRESQEVRGASPRRVRIHAKRPGRGLTAECRSSRISVVHHRTPFASTDESIHKKPNGV